MMLVVAFAQLFCLSTAHMLLITARVISQARKENVSFFTLRCGTTRAEHKIVFMKCNCPVECKQKKNSTATRLQAHMLTQICHSPETSGWVEGGWRGEALQPAVITKVNCLGQILTFINTFIIHSICF